MSKVFRFHNGNDNIEDWQVTEAYGNHAISSIEDPAGESASRQITSIPSPFARMDLIQRAFARINESRKLEGATIFHKMVSDALDVAELFFNVDRFADRLSLVVWDKHQDLKALLESDNPKHRRLGETLKLYLEQDKQAHNFDELNSIYLLNYTGGGPSKMNIIGGTSPSSLFFTSANDLSFVDIQFGAKRVFSSTYLPLYKRDVEFQKYLFGLQKHYPGFNRKFKEVDDYLNTNYGLLSEEVRQHIQHGTEADFLNSYHELTLAGDGHKVEVLGFPLRKRVNAPSDIADRSDFVIVSEKYMGVKPLVLPNEKFTGRLFYTSDYWDANLKSPHSDPHELGDRKLPFVGDRYPYLTVSDFLEPYVIRTVYPIQKSKYFDGNFSSAQQSTKGFILPIKKEFFDFFDVSYLSGFTREGRPVFEMQSGAGGGLTVTLRIPVKKGYISFQRIYYPAANELSMEQAYPEQNKGVIIENQFSLTTFPFYRLKVDHPNVYRVALLDRDVLPMTKSRRYSLKFYRNNQEVSVRAEKARSRKQTDGLSSHFYVLEEAFDFMELSDGTGHRGLLIPLFKEIEPGTEKFTFAVDFGTTNTHIEYRKGDADPVPFEIGDEDLQMASLHEPSVEDTDISLSGTGATALILTLPHEFLPLRLGRKHPHSFPTRTAIHYNEATDFASHTYALADLNLSFTYERELIPKNIKFDTNLKWSDFKANTKELKKVDAYFENLMLLIRNKVMLNGGDPDQAKLVWFYPSSMLPFKIGMMEFKWENLFKRYISDKHSPMKLSESIAPFYYFKNRLGVTATDRSVVSIDIGGGTSDIVVYRKNRPEVLTSIRFAANTIFGDGYNSNPALNGFVKKYSERFKDLGIVSYYLPKLQRSEDIAGFFFSLENNRDLQKRNIDASFARELHQDADFRIVFLVFYSAIIYHLSKLMKAKGLDAPAYITFSGTGSKVIDFADPRPKLKGLSKLTEEIFALNSAAAVNGGGGQHAGSEHHPESQASTSFHANSAADATMLPHLSTDDRPHIADGVQERGDVESDQGRSDGDAVDGRSDGDSLRGRGDADSGKSHSDAGSVQESRFAGSVQGLDKSSKAVSIELKQYENPKEITCKGGLMIDEEIDIEGIKSVLLGDSGDRLIENQPLDYKDISEELIESVLTEYRAFIDQFFSLHAKMNFSNEFGVNPATIGIAHEALTSKAKEYLLLGIEQQVKELNDGESVAIAESLFFYPLVGGLNRLAFEVYGSE